jgi:hypothetical protein
LVGLIAAPSRGLIVYSPALVLALLGIKRLWSAGIYCRFAFDDPAPEARRQMQSGNKFPHSKGLILAWMVGAALTMLLYARWHEWPGGWCYGPRLLCETMPLFCLLFAIAYDGFSRRASRQFANILVAASVCVHVVGLFGYGKGYCDWQVRHPYNDAGRNLFSVDDTQIEAEARYVVSRAADRFQQILSTR